MHRGRRSGRGTIFFVAFFSFFLTFSPSFAQAANFVTDTFTDTASTSLASHVGEVGATWTANGAFPSSTTIISGANRARSNINGFSVYNASGIPASADYSVSADFFIASNVGAFGVLGRSATSTATYYLFDWEGPGNPIKLYTIVNGSAVGTTATAAFSPTLGQTYRFELSMRGTSITGYVDGVQVVSKIDSNITAAGASGFFSNWGSTDTTAYHIDNFSADDTSGLVSVNAGDLWSNGYDNTGNPLQSTFSFIRLVTDARQLRVVATTSLYSVDPVYASLGLRINGTDQSPITFSANGQATTTRSLSAGTKTIDITTGPQSRPSSTILGTFLQSFELVGGTSYSVTSPVLSDRLLLYGDSITAGYSDSTNNGQKAYGSLLRNAGRATMMEAYGYRALKDDATDSVARAAFVSRITGYAPNAIWLAIGTNDYGLNRWSATSFGTAYAALLDDLHAALPSVPIFCQTPLVRSSEGSNSFTNTLTEYRSQISTICTARPWTTLVDGTQILTTSDLADGIHPSTAGHVKYENFVAPFVAQDGGFEPGLSDDQGEIGDSVTLTLTRALGSTFLSGDSITVDWGDDSTTVLSTTPGSTATSTSHAYSTEGAYSISFSNSENWPNPDSLTYTMSLVSDDEDSSGRSRSRSGSSRISDINDSSGELNSSTATPVAPSDTSPAHTFLRDLTLGSVGTDVTVLQKWLLSKGYLIPSGATGYFGTQTQEALAQYQRSIGITPVAGYFGPVTRMAVSGSGALAIAEVSPISLDTAPVTFSRDLFIGSQGEDVRLLQRLLNKNLFIVSASGPGSVGQETTYFGPSTRDALIRLQAHFKVQPAQGYFGARTRDAFLMNGISF